MRRRWNGDRLLIIAGLALVTSSIAVSVWIYRLPPAQRTEAVGYWGFVLPLAVAVATLWGWLRRVRRPVEARSVTVLTTRLAQAVYGQWRKAADERRLVTPAPIPVRWSLSDLDVAGPVVAAVGPPDQLPAFPPLPGHTTITEEELRAGGGREELYRLFAGLASGRIIVVGAPGSGKSGAAILLVLDTLAHRDSLHETEQVRVPVPVLFTGHGWDPNTTSAQDWLRDRLVATYPLFQRRGGDTDATALVTARDKVALILDGLDETDEALRPAALAALSEAPFRVVVLTRGPEMTQAARTKWLVSAVAVQLHDVTGPEAADYLQRARTAPPPSDWPILLTHLRERPDDPPARGLSTPLTLTLLRDTYHAGDNLGDLLDPTRYGTAEHIERHLIARVLPAAYTPRPGQPAPRYSEAQARHALTFLARRMNQDHTRDLAWWHIPRWAATMPGIFTTGLKYGLVHGLAFGLALGLVLGLLSELTVELVVVTLVVGLAVWPTFEIMGTLTSVRLRGIFRIVSSRRIRVANWRAVVPRQALGRVLISGLVVGLGIGLWGGLGLARGLIFGLVGVLLGVLVAGLTEDGTGEGRPLGPRENLRNHRAAGLLLGLVVGAGFGLEFGLATGLIGLVPGLVFGLVFGFIMGLVIPRSGATTLAWRQLKLAGHVPAVRLMPFLEDARERGVLRTVGDVYQFRHATLQDQLAGQSTPNSAAWRVSS